MNEVKEIYKYISQRLEFWQDALKMESSESMKDWTRGQIFEASKILKHINEEYGVTLKREDI